MIAFIKWRHRDFLQTAAAVVALASLPTFAQPVSAGTKHKIGIIGSGRVASALGTTWAGDRQDSGDLRQAGSL